MRFPMMDDLSTELRVRKALETFCGLKGTCDGGVATLATCWPYSYGDDVLSRKFPRQPRFHNVLALPVVQRRRARVFVLRREIHFDVVGRVVVAGV